MFTYKGFEMFKCTKYFFIAYEQEAHNNAENVSQTKMEKKILTTLVASKSI